MFFRASNRRIQAFVSATVSANEGGLDRRRQRPRPVACHSPAHPAGRCHAGHREGFLTVRGQADKHIAYTRSIHCNGPTLQASVHPLLCAPGAGPFDALCLLPLPTKVRHVEGKISIALPRQPPDAAGCRDCRAGSGSGAAGEDWDAFGFLGQFTVCYVCRIMGDAFHPDTTPGAHPALRHR